MDAEATLARPKGGRVPAKSIPIQINELAMTDFENAQNFSRPTEERPASCSPRRSFNELIESVLDAVASGADPESLRVCACCLVSYVCCDGTEQTHLSFCDRCQSGSCRKCARRMRIEACHLDQSSNYFGRPRGPRMPCGWECGVLLAPHEMRIHFTACPNRMGVAAACLTSACSAVLRSSVSLPQGQRRMAGPDPVS